ncbi:hypothetical protein Glove_37g47 [Diversispora epigaea]|uniref:HAT C-terminal dimerisation domain-containing protein n=1 Tax=Diversispora epigaea TaxID=1348612 RepID=A0A397JR45_9GLOM|nr:hypothetical protein Glove_37g47 [Diversispora epigaea]
MDENNFTELTEFNNFLCESDNDNEISRDMSFDDTSFDEIEDNLTTKKKDNNISFNEIEDNSTKRKNKDTQIINKLKKVKVNFNPNINKETECSKKYKHDGGTGNMSYHLRNTHNINETNQKGTLEQCYIDSMLKKVIPHKTAKQMSLRRITSEWLVTDSLPFNIVHGKRYRKIISKFDPAFTIPYNKSIKVEVGLVYERGLKLLKNLIEDTCETASITTDLWTLTSQMEVRDVILCTERMEYPHTVKRIKSFLEMKTKEFGLEDNGSNMKKTADLWKINRLPCSAYTLQLTVIGALNTGRMNKNRNPIDGENMHKSDILFRIKKLEKFFNSPKQSERLIQTQKELALRNKTNIYPHTVKRIKSFLEMKTKEFGLEDNGSNMKKTADLWKINRLPCSAYTLQLTVIGALNTGRMNKNRNPIDGENMHKSDILFRIKKLEKFFNSPKQSERLIQTQKELALRNKTNIVPIDICENLEEIINLENNENEDYVIKDDFRILRTIGDSKTRWNSNYKSWKRLLELKEAIKWLSITLDLLNDTDAKGDAKKLKKCILTEFEWELLHQFVELLKPFDQLTTYFNDLLNDTDAKGDAKKLKKCILTEFEWELLHQFVELLKPFDQLTTYFNVVYSSIEVLKFEYANGSQLETDELNEIWNSNEDNRDINDNIDSDNENSEADNDENDNFITQKEPANSVNSIISRLRGIIYDSLWHYWNDADKIGLVASLLDPLQINQPNSLDLQSSSSSSTTPKFMKKIFSKSQTNTMQINHEIEIENYLNLPILPEDTNVYTWWNSNKNTFPILFQLARKYLSIPATSVPSE